MLHTIPEQWLWLYIWMHKTAQKDLVTSHVRNYSVTLEIERGKLRWTFRKKNKGDSQRHITVRIEAVLVMHSLFYFGECLPAKHSEPVSLWFTELIQPRVDEIQNLDDKSLLQTGKMFVKLGGSVLPLQTCDCLEIRLETYYDTFYLSQTNGCRVPESTGHS